MNSIKIKNIYKIIIFSFSIALLASIPFFKDTSRAGYDTIFHFSRIEGMARSILDGNWFPKVYPHKLNGYGYVSPTFYCDFLLIIPALIYNSGLSIIKTYKLTMFILSVLSGISIGYTISKISNKKFAPYLGIMLYVLSQYRLLNIYVRGALGELFGFVFFPLIILGAKSILFDSKPKIIYLIIAFSGLVLSHNISFFMGCILLAIIFIPHINVFMKNPSKVITVIISIIITISVTAFFTFPMIEMSITQNFLVFNQLNSAQLLSSNAINPISLITDTLIGFDHPYALRNSLGFSIYLCLFLTIIYKSENNEIKRFLKLIALIGVISIIFTTNIIPWKYLGFLSTIQFPTRLLLISNTCLCVSVPILLFNSKAFLSNKNIFMVIIIVLVQFGFHVYQINKFETFYQDKESYEFIMESTVNKPGLTSISKITQKSMNELAGNNYLNLLMLKETEWKQEITNVVNAVISNKIIKNGVSTSFYVENYIENERIVFPVTYYKGMQANCVDIDGNIKKLETALHVDTGKTEVILNDPTFIGKITVWYNGTAIQKISLILSLVSLLSYIAISLTLKKIKNNNEKILDTTN